MSQRVLEKKKKPTKRRKENSSSKGKFQAKTMLRCFRITSKSKKKLI